MLMLMIAMLITLTRQRLAPRFFICTSDASFVASREQLAVAYCLQLLTAGPLHRSQRKNAPDGSLAKRTCENLGNPAMLLFQCFLQQVGGASPSSQHFPAEHFVFPLASWCTSCLSAAC